MPFKHDIIPYYYQVVTPCLNQHHRTFAGATSFRSCSRTWGGKAQKKGSRARLAEFHWSNCREITSYHDLYMSYIMENIMIYPPDNISWYIHHKFLQKNMENWSTLLEMESVTHWQSQSAVSQSLPTSESVTLRPPTGGEGWLHCGVLPYMHVFSNMQHACLFQALAFQMIAHWPFFLAYNSTYGLGNIQAWFRFYLGLVEG